MAGRKRTTERREREEYVEVLGDLLECKIAFDGKSGDVRPKGLGNRSYIFRFPINTPYMAKIAKLVKAYNYYNHLVGLVEKANRGGLDMEWKQEAAWVLKELGESD